MKDRWLEAIFKENEIDHIEYAEDGTTVIFYFKNETAVTIRNGYNGLQVSYHNL